MYFPYLRGRTFELIALRELADKGLIGNNVCPIIEPAGFSTSLLKTIEAYIKKNKNISVILNPQIGSFSKEIVRNSANKDVNDLIENLKSDYVIKSHLINLKSETQFNYWPPEFQQIENMMLINTDRDCLDIYANLVKNKTPKYVLIPDETSFKRRVLSNKVLLDDKFNKQDRNADYQKKEDEIFSEDHIYYKEEGFIGFGDYSIIGSSYFEKGFAPYAIAIHIVYLANDNILRIRHFVSDSNDDISNPAKKFYEAVSKLNSWLKETKSQKTLGINQLLHHYENGTYPGLGSIKKYSIMNHIELMGKFNF